MRSLGLTELSLSDTTGMANPRQVYDLSSEAMKEFPDVRWFLHFHNTREWPWQILWQGAGRR